MNDFCGGNLCVENSCVDDFSADNFSMVGSRATKFVWANSAAKLYVDEAYVGGWVCVHR